jgi:isopenicillin N synthase-like dioxygenase
MEHFFSLDDKHPIKENINVTGRENTYGWMPMFQEPAYEAGTIAHVESFDFGRSAKKIEAVDFSQNQWPNIPDFKKDIRSIWNEYSSIGMLTLRAIARSLQLPENFLIENCNSQDLSTMRLLNYPAIDTSIINKNSVGISAHTDFECITLISQTTSGLELLGTDDKWYQASSDNKKIVVIIGKMLEVWTNGKIQATKHRVNNREWQRYSMVLFFGVNDEIIVEPHQKFIDKGKLANYSAIKQREHINNEISKAEKNRDTSLNG